jgi:hypothetical protein
VDRVLVVIVMLALVALASAAWRLRRAAAPESFDPRDAGLPREAGIGIVGFSGPYCLACQQWERALGRAGLPFAKIDASRRPELARKYGVTSTPLILAVRLDDGSVVDRFEREPHPHDLDRLRELVSR